MVKCGLPDLAICGYESHLLTSYHSQNLRSMSLPINLLKAKIRLILGNLLVCIGTQSMLIGRVWYNSSSASHTSTPRSKVRLPEWLKNLSEAALVSAVAYDLYLRPAPYNHYAKQWSALLEYVFSYVVLRCIGAWAFQKWKEINTTMRSKLDHHEERE